MTDLQLVTRKGADQRCRTKPRSAGLVRALTVAAKGSIRTTAGAAIATSTGQTARWTVRDRCDGTLVRATGGRLRVQATKGTRKTTTTVRAGRTRLVKARSFR